MSGLAWGCAIFASLVGVVVFGTWMPGPAAAPASVASDSTMKANTALSLAAGGCSLMLVLAWRRQRRVWTAVAARALAAAILLLASATLLEYLSPRAPGVDQLFVRDTITDPSTGPPGRMAFGTAAILAMASAALLLSTSRARALFQAVCLGAIAVSAFSLLAVLFDVDDLYQLRPLSSMAPHVPMATLVLSIGTWCTRPAQQPLATFLSLRPGGVLARRVGLPLVVATILVGAFVESAETRGYLAPRVDSSVLVVAIAGLIAAVLAGVGQSLDRSDAALRRSNQLMALANHVNHVVVRMTDATAMLEAACRIAVDQGGFRRSWAAWLEGASNRPPTSVSAERPGIAALEAPPALVTAALEKMQAGPEPADGSEIGPHAALHGPEIALLILADGVPVGVWYLEADPADTIDEDALALLETVANDMGLAVSQMAAHEGRRHSDQRFEGIIGSAMDAIVSVDEQQRIVLFNPAAERMFGTPRQDVLGQPLDRLIPERFRSGHREHVAAFGRTGGTARAMGSLGQLYGLRAGGEEFPVEASISQIVLDDNRRLFTVILRDQTERTRSEERLRASMQELEASRLATEQLNAALEHRVANRTAELEGSNRELESFSYSISHDLRAPLRAMDGFSQALIEDFAPSLPEQARHYLQRIRTGAQRMGALIDDLLSFSRLSRVPLEKRPVDMTALARECLADLRQAAQAPPALDCRIDELPTAHGERDLLRQVWLNLLDNAIKYSSRRQRPQVHVGSERAGGTVVYFVRDNGAGFDMKYADKLFGVFQRLHRADEYQGTGVGLAIVQRVVHRHGGEVWARAELDRGATFYFRLEAEGG